jgi:hypothetical protein
MKILLAIALLTLATTACSVEKKTKTEKCTFNGQELPCDHEVFKPNPQSPQASPTPSEEIEIDVNGEQRPQQQPEQSPTQDQPQAPAPQEPQPQPQQPVQPQQPPQTAPSTPAQTTSGDSPQTECTNVVTKLIKDNSILVICPTANIETASCLFEAWTSYMTSQDIIAVCKNADANTDECIIGGRHEGQNSAAIAQRCKTN